MTPAELSSTSSGSTSFRAVRQVQPIAFVIENVPEFQRSAQFARTAGAHAD